MEFDFFDSGSTFDINGVKYIKKSKLSPKRYKIAVFSDFSMSGRGSPVAFDRKFLPPFFDVYNLYIVDDETLGPFNLIENMVKLEDISAVGYVDYTEDYISGYNFYIQTADKLYIASCPMASNAVKWVESLRRLLSCAPVVVKRHAKHTFSDPQRIVQKFDGFDPKSFMSANISLFRIKHYRLNEKFDKEAFEHSIRQLKNMLKVLKYNEDLAEHIQPFVVEFHAHLCKSVANSSFEFSIADMSFVYKLIRRYDYLLQKYNITDVCLTKFLVRLNNSLFEQLTSEILLDLKARMAGYLEEAGRPDCRSQFYGIVFEAIEDYASRGTKLKISHDLCCSIVSRVISTIKWQVVTNQAIGPRQLLNIIASALGFNAAYFGFVQRNDAQYLDDKFLTSMDDERLVVENNSLISTAVNELENHFEYQIQNYFSDMREFAEVDVNSVVNGDFRREMAYVKANLPSFYAEPLFNRILNFLLMFYFSKSFGSIADPEYDHEFLSKLKKDQSLLKGIFADFIEEENLAVLLTIFDHLLTLLTEVKYELLLKAIINFSLFFSNKLTTEILVAILSKNIDIQIDVEEELINYFNYCLLLTNHKDMANAQEKNTSLKSSLYKSGGSSKRQICNYLPTIPLGMSGKLRLLAYRSRKAALRHKKEDSIDLSMDMDLVNTSTNERYLENIVKLAVFNEQEFSVQLYTEAMKVG